MTQGQLAAAAGISRRTLERLESGDTVNPGLFTIAALAAALDAPLADVIRAAEGSAGPGLVSAGYEGKTLDTFIGQLSERGVHTLADVRLTPISRKPGFSKNRLAGALSEAGINYLHLRALGNPKANRAPFWDGRAEEGRAAFRRLLTAAPAAAELDHLLTLASRESVAVLCFEHDADRCHRQVICDIARHSRGLGITTLG